MSAVGEHRLDMLFDGTSAKTTLAGDKTAWAWQSWHCRGCGRAGGALLWVRMLSIEMKQVAVCACKKRDGRYACVQTLIAGTRSEGLRLKSSRVEWAEVRCLVICALEIDQS